ncbi:cation channel sperm-associated protein 3-like [Polypterus senegalus]|uniref:cation channel sperm-associated protein 3-like n=1 Tax=Polypterus senegalus TaxID=55291 RepID=UPI001964E1FA|nr:cation channel sperm-associated protein 3-like [Polypterus senegalus]
MNMNLQRPFDYWKSPSHILDFILLVMALMTELVPESDNDSTTSSVLKMLRTARTLKTLKLISYIEGLKALSKAMVRMMKNVVSAIALLFMWMFVFAMLGSHFFGDEEDGDLENWGTFALAMFTLFSLVTVDGWTDVSDRLVEFQFEYSYWFVITFVVIAYFLLFSMFVAVVIMEIQNSTVDDREQNLAKRKITESEMRRKVLEKEKQGLMNLYQKPESKYYKNLTALINDLKNTYHPGDEVVTEDLCTSLSFIGTYLTTLDLFDKNVQILYEKPSTVPEFLQAVQYHFLWGAQVNGSVAQLLEVWTERLQDLYQKAAFVLSHIMEEDIKLNEPEIVKQPDSSKKPDAAPPGLGSIISATLRARSKAAEVIKKAWP